MSGCVLLVSWAMVLLLLNPDQLSAGNAFHDLAAIAPAWFWGLYCLAVGAVQVSAAFVDRARLHAMANILAAMWFASLSAVFFTINDVSTGAFTYGILSVFNVWGAIFFWRARAG